MNNIDLDFDNLAYWSYDSQLMSMFNNSDQYAVVQECIFNHHPFAKLANKFKLRNENGDQINVRSFCHHGNLLFVISGTSIQAYSLDTKMYLFTFEKIINKHFDQKFITVNQNFVFVLNGMYDVFVYNTRGKFIRKITLKKKSEKFEKLNIMKIMCTNDYFCAVYFLDDPEDFYKSETFIICFDLKSNKKFSYKLQSKLACVLLNDQNQLINISNNRSDYLNNSIFDLKTKKYFPRNLFVSTSCIDEISNAYITYRLINFTNKFCTNICIIFLPANIEYCSDVIIFNDCFEKRMQVVHDELNKIEQRLDDNAITNCFTNDLIEIVKSYIPIERDHYIILIAELNGNEFSEYHLRM